MSQGPLIRVHLLLQRTDIRNVHFLIKLLLLSLVPSVVVFTYLLTCLLRARNGFCTVLSKVGQNRMKSPHQVRMAKPCPAHSRTLNEASASRRGVRQHPSSGPASIARIVVDDETAFS